MYLFKTLAAAVGVGLCALLFAQFTFTESVLSGQGLQAQGGASAIAPQFGRRAQTFALVSRGVAVVYEMPMGLIPKEGARLWWNELGAVVELPASRSTSTTVDGAQFISLVSQDELVAGINISLGTLRSAGLELPGDNINKIRSRLFRLDGNSGSLDGPYYPISRLLLRKQPTGQYALSVIATIPADSGSKTGLHVPGRVLSLSPEVLMRRSSKRIELDTITPEDVRSSPWMLPSVTDATLSEDETSGLVLTGTVEFVLGLSATKVPRDMVSAKVLLADGGQSAIPNFGDHAKLKIGTTSEPVVLINRDGTSVTAHPGAYVNMQGKWVDAPRAKTAAGATIRPPVKKS
jgi:hypothetical protein